MNTKAVSRVMMAVIIAIIIIIAAVVSVYYLYIPSNQLPEAVGIADRDLVDVGAQIMFNASASSDPDGEIVEYQWIFGDGKTGEGENVLHTYDTPGRYIILLTVFDNGGANATNEGELMTVTVLHPEVPSGGNSPPIALVAVDKDIIEVDANVTFDATSSWAWVYQEEKWKPSTDLIKVWSWDFGDGTSAEGNTTSHKYTKPGNYACVLTVTAENGEKSSFIQTIHVLTPMIVVTRPIRNPDTFIRAGWADEGEPEFGSVDPATGHDRAALWVHMHNMYEGLLGFEKESSTLIPALATEVPSIENGLISPDGLTYTYPIRHDVKFHTGNTMTAEDVKFSWDRVIDMNQPVGLETYMTPFVESTEVVDEYTFQVKLKKISPMFNNLVASVFPYFVVSKDAVLAHGGVIEGERNDWVDKHSIGTGPFMLEEWVPNERLVMVRFDEYWRGPAKLKRVINLLVPSLATRILMLQKGDVDEITIELIDREKVAGLQDVKIIEGHPKFRMLSIGFQFDADTSEYPASCDVPSDFFTDVNLRKAFLYAFPYDEFMEEAFKGLGSRPRVPISIGMLGDNTSVPVYTYDPDKAMEYFQMTEWWDKGFTIPLYIYDSLTTSMALHYKDSLEKLNPKFRVEVLSVTRATAYKYFLTRKLIINPASFVVYYPDPDAICRQMMFSMMKLYFNYDNLELYNLIDEAATILNTTKRAELYSRIQWMVYEDAPVGGISCEVSFDVMRDWVQGFYWNPISFGYTYYDRYKA